MLLVFLLARPAPLGVWQCECLLLHAANSSPGQGEDWAPLHQDTVVGSPMVPGRRLSKGIGELTSAKMQLELSRMETTRVLQQYRQEPLPNSQRSEPPAVPGAVLCTGVLLRHDTEQTCDRATITARENRGQFGQQGDVCWHIHRAAGYREVMCSILAWNTRGSSPAARF